MIPQYLTIKGIYSYQEKEQTIDFQYLTSAGLFGIFGSVGSGKSTILEAISYALYGETERLNRRDDRGYNMMNLKSDQLLIDFIFKNGDGENQYRFIAKAKRNSKQFTDVKTISREAFKKDKNDWIPISADSAEEITGLNYLNFRRTVIIPQGRFQEFLQLGDTDRTKMMKELFHLEKYDLSFKTKLLEDKNNERLVNLDGQLQQLTYVSEEKIAELELEWTELNKKIESNKKQLHEKQALSEAQKLLKELFEKTEKEEKEFSTLINQKPEFENIKSKIKTYQECILKFKNQMDRISESEKKSKRLSDEILQNKKQYQTISVELEKTQSGFVALKSRFDSKEDLKNQALDLEKILKAKQIALAITKLEERIAKGLKTQEETTVKINKLEEKLNEIKSKSFEIKKNQTDIANLMEIKNWFNQLNSIKKELDNIEKYKSKFDEKAKEQNQEMASILSKLGFDNDSMPENEIKNKIATLKDELDTELETVENEIKHMNVKLELSRYSENLIEGKACPVCGSMHHPEKMEAHDLSEKTKLFTAKQANLKTSLKDLNQLEKEIGNKTMEYKLTKERLQELEQKYTAIKSDLKNHKDTYHLDNQISEDELEKAFIIANKEKNDLLELEKELTTVEENFKTETKNKEKYQEMINAINNELLSNKATYETLFSQILTTELKDSFKLSNEELENKIVLLTNEYQKLIVDYEVAEKNINRLKPEKDKLHGIIETKETDLNNITIEIENISKKLDEEIALSKFKSREEIKQIIDIEIDVDKENKKIQDFENKLYSLNQQLEKLKKEAAGKSFDQVAYDQLIEELQDFKLLIDEQNKKLGSLEKDQKELKTKIAEKTKLLNEQFKLNLRAENIKTLKNLFKASGFVNYVSSVYLQNLIHAANKRFTSLTSQKLRLELTDTNDFIIRDFLNEGKTRSVKTLSGGQTFQASLSLALALADNIQSVTKSEHNFFFLDEGFGSLDKEALSVVFASLKTLRKENRIVGVISHVEEMQHEIDNYLKIENDAEFGSKIIRSWE